MDPKFIYEVVRQFHLLKRVDIVESLGHWIGWESGAEAETGMVEGSRIAAALGWKMIETSCRATIQASLGAAAHFFFQLNLRPN